MERLLDAKDVARCVSKRFVAGGGSSHATRMLGQYRPFVVLGLCKAEIHKKVSV